MIPKLNWRSEYASKPGILCCRPVATKRGKKVVTGHVMRQARGRELRQIT